MSDLLSDRYLANPEGLTVRQLKAHIATWPDETPEGKPTLAMMVLVSDDSGVAYVPIGEVTEVHSNETKGHMIVLPQRAVGKLLYGATHHSNAG